MQIIKQVRQYVAANPLDPSAQILARLVLALEAESDLAISDIYRLDYDHFQMALKVLEEWRIDRYFAGKAKLFDISLQAVQLRQAENVA